MPPGASAWKRTGCVPTTASSAGRAETSQMPEVAPEARSTCVKPAPVTCVLMSAPIAPSFATAPSATRKRGLLGARIATGMPARTPSRASTHARRFTAASYAP